MLLDIGFYDDGKCFRDALDVIGALKPILRIRPCCFLSTLLCYFIKQLKLME
jgi:hypothetical protein